MKIVEIFNESNEILTFNKIENPALNTGIILEEVTGIKRLSLPLSYQKELSNEQITRIREMIAKRSTHEPLQYILGYTEFYGYRIELSPAVLIPRPETEYLIEAIHKDLSKAKRIIDIGTGSGAIAITLKKLYPQAEVVALDISQQALKLAQSNARLNGVEIKFIEANIYSEGLGKFDLIVSNPPYVTEDEYLELPVEVRKYEPQLALVGAESGLYFYRKIIELSRKILTENASIYFEIGETQALAIKDIALSYNYTNIEVIRDLAGKERVVVIKN